MSCHTLLQLSDPHIVSDPDDQLKGVDTASSFSQVLAHLLQQHSAPDALLLTGDLIHDDSREAYQRLQGLMESVTAPIHALPGNHDVPDLMREVYANGRISTDGSFLLGAWQIILLDSSVADEPSGTLAESELERLETCLKQYPDAPTLVCIHHHPVDIGSAWMDTMTITNGDQLLKTLARHTQVKALAFGHVHQEIDRVVKGVRLLGTPSTCVQFLPGSDDFALDTRPPGYRCLYLHDSGQLETEIVRVPVTT